jgi:hypothetical protein
MFMKNSKVIIAGLSATAVMTLFMLLAPFLQLPEMNWGKMLGALFGHITALGWVLHFLIGIFFAFLYVVLFNHWLPVINDTARGMVYGIIVFVATEIVFQSISLLGLYTWEMKENMWLSVFGNMLACLTYGTVLGGVIKDYKFENPFDWERKKYLKYGDQKTHPA